MHNSASVWLVNELQFAKFIILCLQCVTKYGIVLIVIIVGYFKCLGGFSGGGQEAIIYTNTEELVGYFQPLLLSALAQGI